MTTYTLSIEDRVGTGVNVTQRAVMVSGNLVDEIIYNPNAEPKEGFNPYDNTTFDTPFSIVHPLRAVAKQVVDHYHKNGGGDLPKLKYDKTSVHDAQQRLFGNILRQELYGSLYGNLEAGARDLLANLSDDRMIDRLSLEDHLARLEEKKQEILSLP